MEKSIGILFFNGEEFLTEEEAISLGYKVSEAKPIGGTLKQCMDKIEQINSRITIAESAGSILKKKN